MDWQTVVTSAAVGAVAATLGQLLGQALERRHRERELILRFSIEAARAKREDAILVAREQGLTLTVPDPLYLAADYYPLVKRLLRSGRHPKEVVPTSSRRNQSSVP